MLISSIKLTLCAKRNGLCRLSVSNCFCSLYCWAKLRGEHSSTMSRAPIVMEKDIVWTLYSSCKGPEPLRTRLGRIHTTRNLRCRLCHTPDTAVLYRQHPTTNISSLLLLCSMLYKPDEMPLTGEGQIVPFGLPLIKTTKEIVLTQQTFRVDRWKKMKEVAGRANTKKSEESK